MLAKAPGGFWGKHYIKRSKAMSDNEAIEIPLSDGPKEEVTAPTVEVSVANESVQQSLFRRRLYMNSGAQGEVNTSPLTRDYYAQFGRKFLKNSA